MANGYETPPSPPPHLLDLHPVETLLALLLISGAALHRLVIDPPRPIRRRKRFYALDEVDSFPVDVEEELLSHIARQVADWKRQPQASAAPAVGIAPGPTVAELRTMARQRGILSAGNRPIHKARRADLVSALGL